MRSFTKDGITIISESPFIFELEEKVGLNQIGMDIAKYHGWDINGGVIEERYVASLRNIYKIEFNLNLHPGDRRYSWIYVPEEGLEKLA